MGIISVEKLDHLYWLGRYTERVYTTLRNFFRFFDRLIDQPEGYYKKYCERLNIPDIYTSNHQFVGSYIFDQNNPDSVYANMMRAYDNAVVLRDELSSNVLSYIHLSLDVFEKEKATTAPLLELQQVIDYILAFWGCVDDYVDSEDCRNIMKCGKYVERIDLYIRLNYHTKDIEKEFSKLVNRIYKTHMCYNMENLDRLTEMVNRKSDWKEDYREALNYLGNIIEVR